MTSNHLVDPELRPMLEGFPKIEFSIESLPLIRAAIEQTMAMMPKVSTPHVTSDIVTISGSETVPDLRVFCYRPVKASAPLPAILHIHGGGYVVATPETMEVQNRQIVEALDCAIFSVDYRLAPEVQHPGPVEDCYVALCWLHANAEALNVDRARIGVMGESAGGGLAAGLALLARDRGGPELAFQHLVYPMIDDRTCVMDNPHPYAGEFLWTRENNIFGWASLLGTAPGGPDISPYAAAARAEDLTGLPPTFISTGAIDLFLEENMIYAQRLSRAGVAVELHVYPGAYHGFQLAAETRVASAAIRISLDALRRALHG